MKTIQPSLAVMLLLMGACQQQNSTLDSKNREQKNGESHSLAAERVHGLKTSSGILQCSGVDSKMRLIRTAAEFNQGKLQTLTVTAYADKNNPAQPLNDLTANLKVYEIFSKEIMSKAINVEVDLDGRKFEIEVTTVIDGAPAKTFDLDIRADADGEGGHVLNGDLEYKDVSMALDLGEVLMGCSVQPKS